MLLARFVPIGVKDPNFEVQSRPVTRAVSGKALALSAVFAGVVGIVGGGLTTALLGAMQAVRTKPAAGFDFGSALSALLHPAAVGDWVTLAGIVIFGVMVGLLTAAVIAARSGAFYIPEQEAEPSAAGAKQ
jgi:PAT family beta-lactamase induction signal transducer AmpG